MGDIPRRNDGSKRPMTLSRRKLQLAVRLDKADPELSGWIDEVASQRPSTRGECRHGVRPCPFVSCRYHLYIDVNPNNGSIKLNFPDLQPWELPVSCALDVAENGGLTLEEVGNLLNLTRERIRQSVNSAKTRLRAQVQEFETTPMQMVR